MADGRETSVLFSLKNLLDIEDERVRDEHELRCAREAAEAAAAEAARRAAHEAELARERARALAAERQRSAEEEERHRLAALQAAAVERARLEVEAAAGVEARVRRQEHELRLQQIAERGRRRRAGMLALVTHLAWGAVVLGGALVYFVGLRPAAERQRVALEALAAAEGERADTSAQLTARANARADALDEQLEQLEQQLSELRDTLPPPSAVPVRFDPPRPSRPPAPTPPTPSRCRSESGDPLDYSLCR